MRAWIAFVVACSFPTKHAGTTSDAPPAGDGSAQVDTMRMADASIDSPQVAVKRVFVSSALLFGNNQGPPAVDSQCNNFANAAGLSGTWLAWVSTPSLPANQRMMHATVPYTLVDRQTFIAQNWADLTDGNLAHPIDLDEFGQPPPMAGGNCFDPQCLSVWTGTNPLGNFISPNCQNWTIGSSIADAVVGNYMLPTPEWTDQGQLVQCGFQAPIYCVEQ